MSEPCIYTDSKDVCRLLVVLGGVHARDFMPTHAMVHSLYLYNLYKRARGAKIECVCANVWRFVCTQNAHSTFKISRHTRTRAHTFWRRWQRRRRRPRRRISRAMDNKMCAHAARAESPCASRSHREWNFACGAPRTPIIIAMRESARLRAQHTMTMVRKCICCIPCNR